MDVLEDGKKKIKSKYNEQGIVPVHSSSNALNRSINQSRQSNNCDIMKVKEDDSEDDNLSESTTNVDHSDWLCGGPLGGKGTVLVFRSCVLAPKEKSYSYSSNTISGLNSIVKKPAQTCDKTIPESKLDDVTDVSNEVTNGDLTDASIADSDCSTDSSADTSKSINPKDGVEPKRKRDIRDVLNDINNITLKRRLDINNSTAVKPNSIKKSPQSDEENISQETLSTRSSHSSVLNEHNENKQPEKSILESPLGSSSKFPIIQSPVISHTPNVSLSFDSTFSEIYNKEYKDIKMLERNEMPASLLDLKYKTIMTETKLLNRILQAHGLSECPSHSKDYVLLWTGLHPKPDLLKSLCSYQRVNHFPRSYELTRKDKLFKNIEKMQHFRGAKNFDFVPMTFLMPVEYKELCSAHYRTKGPWIIKPAASSRGRGIYIVNAPDKIPKGESVVVAKYIDKPLLVDGHKCDLRLYVCVTSFDPLLIYMYEEGLVRFATVKYDKTNKNLWNPCMHLCNYSINKYHSDYIKCEDPSAENVGHKWTLSALLRHLRRQGRDTGALMTAIEDVVVKSIFSCTQSIACASRMFVPHFSNCFELYGFDILIDDTLKPWLLEINLSPSLGCDSPLDARLKSSLVADTLTLVGVPAYSPTIKTETATNTPSNSNQTSAKPVNLKMRIVGCHRVHSAENMPFGMKKGFTNGIQANGISFLTNDELRIIKLVKAQYQRRGGYVRIFPSQDSWQKYAQYLDPVTGIPVCNTTITNTMDPHALVPHNYNLLVHSQVLPHFDQTMINSSSSDPPERLMRYERVLPVCPRVSLEAYNTAGPSRVGSASKTHFDSKTAKQHIKSQLEQGMHLTLGESRRAFGMFLNLVLKRISNSKSEQSAHHAELIHRFLKRAANTLKMPYNLKNPSQRMHDKDKAAMIAKQLSDFLYLYHRETDMCTSSADQRYCVSNIHFAQFIYGASEIDLEDILLMVLKAEGNVAPFLGDRQSPFCIDIPPSAITRQPGKSVPVKNNQLLRYLTYITPLHSRRFRAPSPEPNSLSLPALDNENATESEPVSLEESVE